MIAITTILFFFFFNDTATTEIYTLSLHDALPICAIHIRYRCTDDRSRFVIRRQRNAFKAIHARGVRFYKRSEEHTSELQSQSNLVCRLLLEKKKKNDSSHHHVIPSIRRRYTRTLS